MLVNSRSEQAEITKAQMVQLWALFSQIQHNVENNGNTRVTAKLAEIGNYLTDTWSAEYEEDLTNYEHAENIAFEGSKEEI